MLGHQDEHIVSSLGVVFPPSMTSEGFLTTAMVFPAATVATAMVFPAATVATAMVLPATAMVFPAVATTLPDVGRLLSGLRFLPCPDHSPDRPLHMPFHSPAPA